MSAGTAAIAAGRKVTAEGDVTLPRLPIDSREAAAVVFQLADDDGPALGVRLKQVLKHALRSHGLRCVWVEGLNQ